MSAPSDRQSGQPTPLPLPLPLPLHERSESQKNKLAIRIVPYTPPRIASGERVPSQSSSHYSNASDSHAAHARKGSSGNYYDQESTSLAGPSRLKSDGKIDLASRRGSALSLRSSSSLPLAEAQDERVSGPKPAPEGPGVATTRSLLRSPASEADNISSINAPGGFYRQPAAAPSSELSSPRTPVSAGPSSMSQPRRGKFVTVHADKTFSVQLRPVSIAAASDLSGSIRSPPASSLSHYSSSRTSSSHDHPSIDAWSDDRGSSPTFTGTNTTILDRSLTELTPFTPSPGSSTVRLADDPITASPWNYQLVGGLRKVPKTPDPKQRKTYADTDATISLSSSPADTITALPEITVDRDEEATPSRTLEPKASFASTESAASTTSETSNYKVYGHSPAQGSSDSLALLPSSSHSNYEILGESSPVAPPTTTSSPSGWSDSNENYVLHGEPSPLSSAVANRKQPSHSYSQESLVVPPLSLQHRPSRRRSPDKFGYYKRRSRESLRTRTSSTRSVKSTKSNSSIATDQDVLQVFVANPVLSLDRPLPPVPGSSGDDRQDSPALDPSSTPDDSPWSLGQKPGGSSTADPSSSTYSLPRVPMVETHPHVWSSQLSTVISESEDSTDPPTRSVSPSTGHDAHRRRSSAGWASSSHSRQLPSISSSLAAQLEEGASTSRGSASRSESLERPRPTASRAGPSQARTVRDQDEHGDGLADLHDVPNQPLRSGLSAYFSNSSSSSRNLHSSGSSKANSFSTSSIPAWARVYYGSGERRLVAMPSISSLSEFGAESRPASSRLHSTDSPSTDHFPMAIFNPRRRAKEVNPPHDERPFSDSASVEIAPAQPGRGSDYGVFRTLKRKTSSIWSPHLRTDRRASRYSMWEPPSVTWSADSGFLGKRNAQVALFAVGFIFPLAWILAALLPLPSQPKLDMTEAAEVGESRFRSSQIDASRRLLLDESKYESARWWRHVNRVMAFVGLLIMGAIVALVVVGVHEGWVVRAD